MANAPAPAKPAPAAPAAPQKVRATALLRYARISARKMRYVVDLVRGKDYNSALAILRSCSKRGAPFCMKLLESAAANAENLAETRNLDVDRNNLHVVEARVEGGPIIKRSRPSSQRRPTMIKKRLCHVRFTLEERPLKESRRERAERQKRDRKAASKKPAEPKPVAVKPSDAPKAEGGSKPEGKKE